MAELTRKKLALLKFTLKSVNEFLLGEEGPVLADDRDTSDLVCTIKKNLERAEAAAVALSLLEWKTDESK